MSLGIACAWHFRHAFRHGASNFIWKFLVPALSGVILFALLNYSVYFYADPSESDSALHLFGWHVGSVLFIALVTALIGLAAMVYCRFTSPEFFLNRAARYGPSLTELGDVVALDPEFVSEQDS